ncbi:FecR family protein [Pinibacter aurantiacus]|uniref:FecR domain-containing protein n=1 Tax=Pinibacter aurantiacus TaxID=2851599 RepID=A0A9E2SCZ8_9BACT|nr:FecR family protein [Pinibacter aurantiacus]MBV4358874.1 FecR domain-containing protein [Pinibacter aurantiacus]
MTQNDQYYQALLAKFLDNQCSREEFEVLMDFLATDESNALLSSALREESNISDAQENISPETSNRMLTALTKQINIPAPITIHLKKKFFMAAAVVAALTIGLFLFAPRFKSKPAPANTVASAQRFKNDVQPGTNKATLTLGDGSTVNLDDSQNGTLAQQGGSDVIKEDNKLSYSSTNTASQQVVFNTVATPRGGQYQLQLPDGTLVWLNAATTLKFPTAFYGKERRVEINGEAYFEVAQNRNAPFIVSVGNAEVQVLGTRFNVMAYSDEGSIKTTLLDGGVRFKSRDDSSVLKPGEQSMLLRNGKIKINTSIDIDAVMAWKNGMMNFNEADLTTVMRQLSRWYDVDIEYQNATSNQTFVGELPKDLTLMDVLKALERTGNLRFGIEGKKIIVLPEPK